MIRLIVSIWIASLLLINKPGNCTYPGDITGPKSKSSRIAIVGGDFSGIYMAYLLKEKGYTNIAIYEKEDRLGGQQTASLRHRGVNHELGTFSFILADGENKMASFLLKFFNVNLLKEIPLPNIWLNEKNYISLDQYLLIEARKSNNTLSTKDLKMLIMQKITEYDTIHKTLIGEKVDGIYQELSSEKKLQLGGVTFNDFMKTYKLTILRPIFNIFFTMSGYGELKDVLAIYVLYRCSPVTMATMTKRLHNGTGVGYYLPQVSIESLLENVVTSQALNVVKQTKVAKLTRTHSTVVMELENNGTTDTKELDFVIWTPQLRTSLRYFNNPPLFEYQVFLRGRTRYMKKTLVDTDMRRSDSPIDYLAYETGSAEYLTQVDFYAISMANKAYYGFPYRTKIVPTGDDLNATIRSSVFTQISDVGLDSMPHDYLTMSLKQNMGATTNDVIQSKSWSYFWNYPEGDMVYDSIFHRILEMQGRYKMWYIGASVWCDSIADEMTYNELLVSKMVASP